MKNTNKKTAASKAVKTKKISGSKTPMYILLGVITFLLVLTVSLAAVYCYTNPATDNENPFGDLPVEDVGADSDDKQKQETDNKPHKGADGRNNNMYNLLIMGKDYWSGSTDVLMIMSVNIENDEINVLQIPRDSTVDCGVNENHGKRVNAIYAYARQALRREASNPSKEYDDPVMGKIAPLYTSGLKKATDNDAKKYNDELLNKMGAEYLREVIKRTFCIAIDGYVMVDTSGFRKIVDVLEGVEVDVPMNMHYEDPEQNLYIHLNKGLQTLNGKQAEGFVRYRYGYVDGDIGRVNAQKIFVTALAKKLLSFSTVAKIQPIIETCMEYTTTNLSTTSILGYAKIMLGMNMNNIKFYTCPGEAYRTSSGAWYYSLYMDENLEIINQHFNDYDRQVTPDDVTLREVVRNYNISYDNQGITAEDIENNKLDVQHSAVTYNPVDTPTSSTVTAPSVSASSSEKEEIPEEEIPDESIEDVADEKDENAEEGIDESNADGEDVSQAKPDDEGTEEEGTSKNDIADENADEAKDGEQDETTEGNKENEVADDTERVPDDSNENIGDEPADEAENTETEEGEKDSSDAGEKTEENEEPISDNTGNEKKEENSDVKNGFEKEAVTEKEKETTSKEPDTENFEESEAEEKKTEENIQDVSEESTSDDENNIDDME